MHEEQGHIIADSKADFTGWEVMRIESYKPGIKRVFVRKVNPDGSGSMMIIYSENKYTEDLILRKNSVPRSGNV